MNKYRLQPAHTSYQDWVGTAAAENSFIVGSGDLYELAGLSHDDWSILAIDLDTHSHGKPSNWSVDVYAVDLKANGVATHEDLKHLEASNEGSVPVTQFHLHDVSLEDVVRCLKVIQIQLTSHNFKSLDVVARGDFPVQE